MLSPYTKRYAKGRRANGWMRSGSPTFDIAGMPINIKAGQHTVYWGDSLLLGGAIHGVSYAQNSIDLWKGFATPGAEAKELFRPGRLTMQAQATNELSLAGQWFYNWQAVRVPESGTYLTVNDALNSWRRIARFSAPNPFAAAIPGAPAFTRLWNTNNVAAVALQREPRRLGHLGALESRNGWTARWASTTATRPTSCRSSS